MRSITLKNVQACTCIFFSSFPRRWESHACWIIQRQQTDAKTPRSRYSPPPPPRLSPLFTGALPLTDFYVSEFSGKKSLVVSNLSRMGARNPYLGIAYIALGSLSLAVGVGFAIKHISDPRKLGDTKFLVWKDTAL